MELQRKIKKILMRPTAYIQRLNGKERRVLLTAFLGVLILTGLLTYQNIRQESMGGSSVRGSDGVDIGEVLDNQFGSNPSYSKTYHVSSRGLDSNDGTTAAKPLLSIDKALSFASAGDTVELADGDYNQTVATVKSGSKASPIIVRGGRGAVVRGVPEQARIMEVRHSYITLEGFTIDGKNGPGDKAEDYRNKLLYVIGSEPNKGVEGLRVSRMLLQNAGGECVRLRYFARSNEIADSEIKNCGIYDFRFDGGSKNGEGIYIGTAPEQLADGKNPTADPDVSTGNVIRNNTIETHGNECVDIKESSVKNLVEGNTCQYQMDPESAGFDARGDDNIFRANTSANNVGAGFRLGGDTDSDGINNDVYDNIIRNNKGGALKILRQPQGKICGNKLDNNANKGGKQSEGADVACGN